MLFFPLPIVKSIMKCSFYFLLNQNLNIIYKFRVSGLLILLLIEALGIDQDWIDLSCSKLYSNLMAKKDKIVVTGGAGFVGTNLIDFLVKIQI